MTQYRGIHCDLAIERPRSGVVVVRISGTDIGEFGDGPLRVLEERLDDAPPVRLFIDARHVRGASIEVSADWACWLAVHKVQLREIHMLTGSRYIEVTADFVRRFAALEGMMRIYTDPAAFNAELTAVQGQCL